MPRLTSMPSRSSRAMRWAMMVCGSIGSALHDEVVDQGSGRDHVVGPDDADRHDVVCPDEDRVSCHGHQRIEVPSRECIGEITEVVAEKRVHERKVGPQRGLKQIRPADDLDRAFAGLDHRADPGWGEHPAEAAATGADALHQGSLRHEVDLERARHHLLLGFGIEADMAHDGLADQAGWHRAKDLVVPDNLTLVLLPARAPELNPVENIWQSLRDNWLSSRVFASYAAIVDHCCDAWNRLIDQPWIIMSIGLRDWANA